MIRFGPEIASNPDEAFSREWLETNGLGGFASGTVGGAHTRRYHGLLIAALGTPSRRCLLLAKVEETAGAGADSTELGANIYPEAIHPEGYKLLEEFRLDPRPVWSWRLPGGSLEKSVHLVAGENAVILEYQWSGDQPLPMILRPLLAFRDYHSLTHSNDGLNAATDVNGGTVTIQPYPDLPSLHFSFGSATLVRTGQWYYRFQYPRERERGLDFEEDLFQPFELHAIVAVGETLRIVASTESVVNRDRGERPRQLGADPDLDSTLRRAAKQFFVTRSNYPSVIAGYHWFTDWGRDTFIALPSLARASSKPELVREVAEAFLPWMRQGLLPNRFPDAGAEPEYNSTDATLWFVEALRDQNPDWVRERCGQALREIVEWRERGTLYGIRADNDGLLTGGEPGVQLTWMDAKVNGEVITERRGKPVEIQALWYNALRLIAAWTEDRAFADHCGSLAERARASFNAQFWNASEGCLFDVVDGDTRDPSIRPNQIFALAFPGSILDPERRASVLDVVTRELLTPFGLRTLSPRDRSYRGRCEGDVRSRDGAYHQGTVWPWLLGPYARAVRNVRGEFGAHPYLAPFREHLLQAGIGQISEIFDGDAPHSPRGCIAQAWSVAALLDLIS